jgi:hypothetical protein
LSFKIPYLKHNANIVKVPVGEPVFVQVKTNPSEVNEVILACCATPAAVNIPIE